MTASHLREHGSDARVTLVTPEEAPLALFGPEAERAIRPMLDARADRTCAARSLPAAVRFRELHAGRRRRRSSPTGS